MKNIIIILIMIMTVSLYSYQKYYEPIYFYANPSIISKNNSYFDTIIVKTISNAFELHDSFVVVNDLDTMIKLEISNRGMKIYETDTRYIELSYDTMMRNGYLILTTEDTRFIRSLMADKTDYIDTIYCKYLEISYLDDTKNVLKVYGISEFDSVYVTKNLRYKDLIDIKYDTDVVYLGYVKDTCVLKEDTNLVTRMVFGDTMVSEDTYNYINPNKKWLNYKDYVYLKEEIDSKFTYLIWLYTNSNYSCVVYIDTYVDIRHNLGSDSLIIQIFDTDRNLVISDVSVIDTLTVRVKATIPDTYIIFIIKQTNFQFSLNKLYSSFIQADTIYCHEIKIGTSTIYLKSSGIEFYNNGNFNFAIDKDFNDKISQITDTMIQLEEMGNVITDTMIQLKAMDSVMIDTITQLKEMVNTITDTIIQLKEMDNVMIDTIMQLKAMYNVLTDTIIQLKAMDNVLIDTLIQLKAMDSVMIDTIAQLKSNDNIFNDSYVGLLDSLGNLGINLNNLTNNLNLLTPLITKQYYYYDTTLKTTTETYPLMVEACTFVVQLDTGKYEVYFDLLTVNSSESINHIGFYINNDTYYYSRIDAYNEPKWLNINKSMIYTLSHSQSTSFKIKFAKQNYTAKIKDIFIRVRYIGGLE